MADKQFVVSHGHARAPLTVEGKNLEDAIKKAGLDPSIWKLLTPLKLEESPPVPEKESPPSHPKHESES